MGFSLGAASMPLYNSSRRQNALSSRTTNTEPTPWVGACFNGFRYAESPRKHLSSCLERTGWAGWSRRSLKGSLGQALNSRTLKGIYLTRGTSCQIWRQRAAGEKLGGHIETGKTRCTCSCRGL